MVGVGRPLQDVRDRRAHVLGVRARGDGGGEQEQERDFAHDRASDRETHPRGPPLHGKRRPPS
jgi:hypothetical protein